MWRAAGGGCPGGMRRGTGVEIARGEEKRREASRVGRGIQTYGQVKESLLLIVPNGSYLCGWRGESVR
jgi:hypothetical protein